MERASRRVEDREREKEICREKARKIENRERWREMYWYTNKWEREYQGKMVEEEREKMRKGAWETKSLVRTNISVWFYLPKLNHLTFWLLTESIDITKQHSWPLPPFSLLSAFSPFPPPAGGRRERERERERESEREWQRERERGYVGEEGGRVGGRANCGMRPGKLPGLSRLFTKKSP